MTKKLRDRRPGDPPYSLLIGGKSLSNPRWSLERDSFSSTFGAFPPHPPLTPGHHGRPTGTDTGHRESVGRPEWSRGRLDGHAEGKKRWVLDSTRPRV